MAFMSCSLFCKFPSASKTIMSSRPFSLAIAINSSFDNCSSSATVKPPSSLNTRTCSLKSATSAGASDGLIRSRNLSPNSEILVAAHELRKMTLDNNRIFFDILISLIRII